MNYEALNPNEKRFFAAHVSSWDDILNNGARTLAPGRKVPNLPGTYLLDHWIHSKSGFDFLAVLDAIDSLVDTIQGNFPNNIFWDLDVLIFSSLKSCSCDVAFDEEAFLGRVTQLEELMRTFGKNGSIRFEYIHDFSMGFDWIKWIDREAGDDFDPKDPFEERFLQYLSRRGTELEKQILAGDKKYPAIENSEFRNIYSFSRSRQDEILLFENLRNFHAIPVPVWDIEQTSRSDKDFFDIRERIADEIRTSRQPQT